MFLHDPVLSTTFMCRTSLNYLIVTQWDVFIAIVPAFWDVTPCKLIARSRVIPVKLTGTQLTKEFRTLYGMRMFITAFTKVCHLSVSRGGAIQSMILSHLLKICFNIILPSAPRI